LRGFTHDRHLDIAAIPCNHPAVAHPSQTGPVCPDITNVQVCVEHTVTPRSGGHNHNKQHAFAKVAELLKCPLNMSIVALGIHGSGMTVWYADRCGVVEVHLSGEDDQLPLFVLWRNFNQSPSSLSIMVRSGSLISLPYPDARFSNDVASSESQGRSNAQPHQLEAQGHSE
jgi:hypothetical protein